MKKLNKIITTIAITAMLTLPVFGAIIKVKPNVSWMEGGSTLDNGSWTG